MKRDVKYNVLSVERKDEDGVHVFYEFNDVLFEAAIVLRGEVPFVGIKKWTNMQTGVVKLDGIHEWERELLYELVKDWEYLQKAAV